MTSAEIKSILPPVAIWMASQTVQEGVRAYHKAKEKSNIEDRKKEAGEQSNYLLSHAYGEGVHVSAQILWKMFQSCTIDCMEAIETVAQTREGYFGTSESYFDDFVKALEKRLGYSVRLRTIE